MSANIPRAYARSASRASSSNCGRVATTMPSPEYALRSHAICHRRYTTESVLSAVPLQYFESLGSLRQCRRDRDYGVADFGKIPKEETGRRLVLRNNLAGFSVKWNDCGIASFGADHLKHQNLTGTEQRSENGLQFGLSCDLGVRYMLTMTEQIHTNGLFATVTSHTLSIQQVKTALSVLPMTTALRPCARQSCRASSQHKLRAPIRWLTLLYPSQSLPFEIWNAYALARSARESWE